MNIGIYPFLKSSTISMPLPTFTHHNIRSAFSFATGDVLPETRFGSSPGQPFPPLRAVRGVGITYVEEVKACVFFN